MKTENKFEKLAKKIALFSWGFFIFVAILVWWATPEQPLTPEQNVKVEVQTNTVEATKVVEVDAITKREKEIDERIVHDLAEFEIILYTQPEKKHVSLEFDYGCIENGICSALMYDAIKISKKGNIVSFTSRYSLFVWPIDEKDISRLEPNTRFIEINEFNCKKKLHRVYWQPAISSNYCSEDDKECKVIKKLTDAFWGDWEPLNQDYEKAMFKQLCK